MTNRQKRTSFYTLRLLFSVIVGVWLVVVLLAARGVLSFASQIVDLDQWQQAVNTSTIQIRAIVESVTTSTTLYAASFGNGILYSTNDGEVWALFDHPGLETNEVYTLEVCGVNNLFAGTWGKGVRRFNLESDTSWQPKNSGITSLLITSIACDPHDSNIIYVGTTDKGLFRSSSNGDTWVEINNNLLDKRVLDVKAINDFLFAGTQNGMFVSDNQGGNWQNAGADNLSGKGIYAILPVENAIWVGANDGVYSSLLDAIAWSKVGNNFGETVYSLAIDQDGRVYAGTKDNKVYRYSEVSWSEFSTDLRASRIYWLLFSTIKPNRFYAGTNDGAWYNVVEPIPEPIPTATPGIQMFTLENKPSGEIQHGQSVTYTVRYQKSISNTTPLANIRITNTIPSNVKRVGPIIAPSDIICSPQGASGHEQVICTGNSLADSNPRQIVYKVQGATPTPTPEPGELEIVKRGPFVATPDSPLTYTLWITNHTEMTLTNLVVTDVVPSGATAIGVAVDQDGIIRSILFEPLVVGASISTTFVMRAPRTIVNRDYGVSATKNITPPVSISAQGQTIVTTYIGEAPPTPIPFVIVGSPAIMSWTYTSENGVTVSDYISSNHTVNSPYNVILPYAAK